MQQANAGCLDVSSFMKKTNFYAGDGGQFPAQGAVGGWPGAGSRQQLRRSDGTLETLAGQGEVLLAPGERIVVRTAAGGGFGPPAEREPELVARDVREGWVSPARARDIYRVVVADDGSVDVAATCAARNEEGEDGKA